MTATAAPCRSIPEATGLSRANRFRPVWERPRTITWVILSRGRLAVDGTLSVDLVEEASEELGSAGLAVAICVVPLPEEDRPEGGTGPRLHPRGRRPSKPGPLHPDVRQARQASALPRIRLHDLRHYLPTLALSADVHPKVVSERLSHATDAFTLDVYSHAVPGLQEEAATKVASLIFDG